MGHDSVINRMPMLETERKCLKWEGMSTTERKTAIIDLRAKQVDRLGKVRMQRGEFEVHGIRELDKWGTQPCEYWKLWDYW